MQLIRLSTEYFCSLLKNTILDKIPEDKIAFGYFFENWIVQSI